MLIFFVDKKETEKVKDESQVRAGKTIKEFREREREKEGTSYIFVFFNSNPPNTCCCCMYFVRYQYNIHILFFPPSETNGAARLSCE